MVFVQARMFWNEMSMAVARHHSLDDYALTSSSLDIAALSSHRILHHEHTELDPTRAEVWTLEAHSQICFEE